MIVPQSLLLRYAEIEPFLQRLKEAVQQTLFSYSQERGFAYSSRTKTLESLSEKIEMARYERLLDIDDLVAFTLIVPNQQSEADVRHFCSRVFDVVEVRDRSSFEKSPELFRFDSTRIVAKLRPLAGLSSNLHIDIYSFKFEIQVRTAFEHAWAVATHDLVYKSDEIDWRKMRVAAQLKASAESLDASVAAFDHLAEALPASPFKELSDKVAVQAAVKRLFEESILPPELKPKDLSRFCENFRTLSRLARPKKAAEELIVLVDEAIRSGEAGPIPLSISLYQLALGLLCKKGVFPKPVSKPLHLTEELFTLFPETRGLERAFDYSLGRAPD